MQNGSTVPTSETKFTVDAILFDMDGTLIDSTAGVVGAWEYWGRKNPELNIHEILRTSHGVRTIDNLRKWCPNIPEAELDEHVNEFEMMIVECSKQNEAAGKAGIVLLPGVKDLLPKLAGQSGWAICTSATTAYATAALETAHIPMPSVFVTADDVSRGKPYPDPYLLGAKKSGVPIENCLVVEDAPTGIASGKASGAKVLAVCTSHTRERMVATEPDFLVPDLTYFSIKRLGDGKLEITIRKD